MSKKSKVANYYSEFPSDRTEEIVINLEFDQDQTSNHLEDINFVFDLSCRKGDRVPKASYRFFADYYHQCDAHLEAISRILDDDSVVVNASIEELRHGKSIFVNVVQQLTRIIDQLEKKDA
jgi:hypothetical protein